MGITFGDYLIDSGRYDPPEEETMPLGLTGARQIVEECARQVRLHAAAAREENVHIGHAGITAIADGLLSRFDFDGFGLILEEPQTVSVWQPIEAAPKDGTWIIGICNDHSRLYRMSWGRARDGHMAWCTADGVVTYGDGLFSPNGGWASCPSSIRSNQ